MGSIFIQAFSINNLGNAINGMSNNVQITVTGR
jgi:hypothetical protein